RSIWQSGPHGYEPIWQPEDRSRGRWGVGASGLARGAGPLVPESREYASRMRTPLRVGGGERAATAPPVSRRTVGDRNTRSLQPSRAGTVSARGGSPPPGLDRGRPND